MKLDSLYQVLLVTEAHDFPFRRLGRDLEAGGDGLPLDDEAVIAGRLEGIRETLEQGAAVMLDQ